MSNIEYELRVLEVEPDEIAKKLEKLGAVLQGEYLFRRHVFNTIPPLENRWVRLRTSGDTTTLAIKEVSSDEVDGTGEWETTVDNFEATLSILEKIGLKSKGYQENKRIEYLLNGAEVCIDTWPKIPPYIEVEADSEQAVLDTLAKLGFSSSDATGMNVEKIYMNYGIDISKDANLSF